MRNSAKCLLATAGICLLTVGHPAADSKPIRMLDASLQVTTVLTSANGIAQPILDSMRRFGLRVQQVHGQ